LLLGLRHCCILSLNLFSCGLLLSSLCLGFGLGLGWLLLLLLGLFDLGLLNFLWLFLSCWLLLWLLLLCLLLLGSNLILDLLFHGFKDSHGLLLLLLLGVLLLLLFLHWSWLRLLSNRLCNCRRGCKTVSPLIEIRSSRSLLSLARLWVEFKLAPISWLGY
jgi:hypothetical protein